MKIRNVILTTVTALATVLSAISPAVAQEFVKVENAVREELPAARFVGAAYAFIWLALLGYVVVVARGLSRTRTEIEELQRRLDRLDGAR